MKALISNDDGVNATGILAAKNAIEDLCEVCVVAPETQQSGIGHAITLYDPLRINPTTSYFQAFDKLHSSFLIKKRPG